MAARGVHFDAWRRDARQMRKDSFPRLSSSSEVRG